MPKAVHKLVKQGKSYALATYIHEQRKQRRQSGRVSHSNHGKTSKTRKAGY